MRRNCIFTGFCALAVLGVVSCGSAAGAAGHTNEKRVLTYAENHVEDYPTTLGAYRFAELVYERTEGRIEIQVNAVGVMGDEKSVIEQMQFGGIDFARVSLSPLSEYVTCLNVLQMPFLYTDAKHMWRVLEGEVGDTFINSFDGSKLIPLSWYDAGARSFYNSVGPITCLEDLRGLKIRVQESELMLEMVEAFGANPILMAFGDVFAGLQTGDVDGAENNWPSYESTNHYEVARYFTIDEHTRVPELQLCSETTWNSLPKADQDILRQCALESAQYQRKLWAEREKTSERNVRAAGCEVNVLSAEERLRFQEAVMPAYEKYCAGYMDLIEEIIALGSE